MKDLEESVVAAESDAQPSRLASTVALWIICCFLFFLFVVGSFVTGLVLKEPDICWILATGRNIVTHGQIPTHDPFSYTAQLLPAKYVLEKWLAEVALYGVWAGTGATGLLVFGAFILCLTFIIVPLRLAYLCGLRGGQALLLAFLACWTSLTHLCVRAEIFSFLLTALAFEVLMRSARRTKGNAAIDWQAVALLALYTALWANLHSVFLLAVLLTGLYCGCAILERALPELKNGPFNWTPVLIFIACIFSTLVNPYGIGLWQYIPFIFGKFTESNNEMQTLNLSNAFSFGFVPFYIMTVWSFKVLFQKGFKRPLEQGDLFFRALVLAGFFGGLKTVRTVPISGLFYVAALCELLRPKPDAELQALLANGAAGNSPNFFASISAKLTELVNPFDFKFPSICLATTCLGAFYMSFVVTPEIPQSSKAFGVPNKAIEFIVKHPLHGNLLNDPHFGNVMEWSMDPNPPVFIDSRYNIFGYDRLADYWTMARCEAGWQALLDKYNIQWVFLSPKVELPKRLAADSRWKCLYSEVDASGQPVSFIYSRNPLDTGVSPKPVAVAAPTNSPANLPTKPLVPVK